MSVYYNDNDPACITVLRLFEAAYSLESQVARLVNEEPSRAVLNRSAACLAIDCGRYFEARAHAELGLLGEPPAEIAAELREALDEAREHARFMPTIYGSMEPGGIRYIMYYCKGIEHPDRFTVACEQQHEVHVRIPDVRWTFVRNRPTGVKHEQVMDVCKPGRGAYPITYTETWRVWPAPDMDLGRP